ncbi:MAG: RluA family pseudouridine synthase [Lachnospiraceae bacterium]|nr:RluA family pseudouridine synthase [Lachnospiraceae bacterium]
MTLNILYEDPELIVVEKPSGVEAQASRGFEADMVSQLQNYIMGRSSGDKHKIYTKLSTDWGKLSTKSGQNMVKKGEKCRPPYVAVIHRLDKPVSGVMVYAKTQKAAAHLSSQVKNGQMDKIYYAVVCGKPVDNVGNYVDYLRKDGNSNRSEIVDKLDPDGKRAELEYQVVESILRDGREVSLVRIHLLTGRHHQIRVQFAGHGTPLWGDNRYHPDFASGTCRGTIALCAASLTFTHPSTGKRMTFEMKPKGAAFGWFGREGK